MQCACAVAFRRPLYVRCISGLLHVSIPLEILPVCKCVWWYQKRFSCRVQGQGVHVSHWFCSIIGWHNRVVTACMASREAKIGFVTGWAGTTRAEIAAVVMVVPLMALMLAGSSRIARHAALPDTGRHPRMWALAALLGEFSALVLPETVVMMSHAAAGPALMISGFGAAALLLLSSQLSVPSAHRKGELNAIVSDFSGRIKGCVRDQLSRSASVQKLPNKSHQRA